MAAFLPPLPFLQRRQTRHHRDHVCTPAIRRRATATIRDIPLITIPMTSGGDVLFPGGNQTIPLTTESAQRLLKTVCPTDPPEFAHLIINAWNEPSSVGTIATVEDLAISSENNTLHCAGVARFRVVHLAEDYSTARVETFHDDPPVEEDLHKLEKLEKDLLQTMANIVNLSLKIAGEDRQKALAETLRRVETFCGDAEEHHWIEDLAPDRRRELLSFIVIDLLSISFMDRREILSNTNTAERLEHAHKCLQPFVNELAAKGAIVSALGRDEGAN